MIRSFAFHLHVTLYPGMVEHEIPSVDKCSIALVIFLQVVL